VIGLARLGLSGWEAEVVFVVSFRKKSGIFGFGSEGVRVRVTPLGKSLRVMSMLREWLAQFCSTSYL
jgi:hypothetical protein